jgi:hypothetical protein
MFRSRISNAVNASRPSHNPSRVCKP